MCTLVDLLPPRLDRGSRARTPIRCRHAICRRIHACYAREGHLFCPPGPHLDIGRFVRNAGSRFPDYFEGSRASGWRCEVFGVDARLLSLRVLVQIIQVSGCRAAVVDAPTLLLRRPLALEDDLPCPIAS